MYLKTAITISMDLAINFETLQLVKGQRGIGRGLLVTSNFLIGDAEWIEVTFHYKKFPFPCG